jgi:hypothetical protein
MLTKQVKSCDLEHTTNDFGRVITLQYPGSLPIFTAIRRASSLVSSLADDPIGLSCRFCYYRRKRRPIWEEGMEWFKQKTSIAGVQVSNWMIVLGAIIIVLLIVQNSH